MLKEIGIQVNIVTLDWGALIDRATKGDFDMTMMGYSLTDPDILYLFLHSSQAKNGINLSGVTDEKLDRLLEKARTTIEPEARKAVYVELQKYIVEQAWWVPLYSKKVFYVIRKPVEGAQLHPLRGLMIHDIWVNN